MDEETNRINDLIEHIILNYNINLIIEMLEEYLSSESETDEEMFDFEIDDEGFHFLK
jgi:hypothetical protein